MRTSHVSIILIVLSFLVLPRGLEAQEKNSYAAPSHNPAALEQWNASMRRVQALERWEAMLRSAQPRMMDNELRLSRVLKRLEASQRRKHPELSDEVIHNKVERVGEELRKEFGMER
jgi:hypothetical protein